jgi:2-oxoglutarate ferredoxin oxidoreductase subunit gamma
MADRSEVRFGDSAGTGSSWQGYIPGRAAAVHSGRNAVMAQSYGPESRGGACQTEVVIDDGEITYPRVSSPSVLVTMSQEAYRRYSVSRPDGCLLVVDEDLVTLDDSTEAGRAVLRAPATRSGRGARSANRSQHRDARVPVWRN